MLFFDGGTPRLGSDVGGSVIKAFTMSRFTECKSMESKAMHRSARVVFLYSVVTRWLLMLLLLI